MLGVHPDLVQQLAETGQARLVFWPVLNHGAPSVYATVTATCAGLQDPDLFWTLHHQLFDRQQELYRADRDFYVNIAVTAGADQDAFAACYDGGEGLAAVNALDEIRLQRGVYTQPQFDIGDQRLIGYQSLDTFVTAVAALTGDGGQ